MAKHIGKNKEKDPNQQQQAHKGKEKVNIVEAHSQQNSGQSNSCNTQVPTLPINPNPSPKAKPGMARMLAFFTADYTKVLTSLQRRDAKVNILVHHVNGKSEVVVTHNAKTE